MKTVGGLIELLKKGESTPERHHNPYLSEALEFSDVLFSGDELLAQFPNLFAENGKPLLLEIGCYLGKNVLEFADKNPGLNVLGVDITYKRVVKSARKIKSENLGNARIGICDARRLVSVVPDGSLAGVCVFFPDPWPKKRHIKNRLLNEEFLPLLRQKLSPNGFFWFKTDSERYFTDVLSLVDPKVWSTSPPDEVPSELFPDAYVTVFEQLFLTKKLPVYRRVFRPAPP
ncbi:MAG: tRNA (guanosine(46)-N7)-methyltransferase TrmB [Silvanigrellales bacterium]|nr:tRNA (guanosine(46)-N7)-methyltransferase TrmB [Silvanigrellales bacterium]